nr:unnamed protein product [Callosobruchus chinensis]
MLELLFVIAICFLVSSITPCKCQDSPFFVDDSNENTTPMTSSPEFLRCLAECPATSEYNPICASDMRSYNNPGKLRCAQRCGASKS